MKGAPFKVLGPMKPRAAAKARGLKRYFTGNPCPHGHVAERLVSTGQCVKCGLARTVRWHRENPDKSRAKRRARRLRNIESEREIVRRCTRKNPQKNRDRVRQWCKDNPEKARLLRQAGDRRRRAREIGAKGTHTAADLDAILNGQKGKCAYCRKNLQNDRHLDHIIALSKGGTDDRSNLQFTCASCNRRKGARDPVEFANALGLLL